MPADLVQAGPVRDEEHVVAMRPVCWCQSALDIHTPLVSCPCQNLGAQAAKQPVCYPHLQQGSGARPDILQHSRLKV